jgi:hypothetical protein
VDHRGQIAIGAQSTNPAALGRQKKTALGLLDHFDRLWESSREGFNQDRVWQRGRILALSSLVCLGRHTVTGLLTTSGRQFVDWSADYRLFSMQRFDRDKMFEAIRSGILEQLPEETPLVAAMDDTIIRKSGAKAHGVAYRRDPLSPPFHVNLVRGQRFIQLSAALPHGKGPCPARMIPVDFRHAPTPKKPGKKATKKERSDYCRAQSKMKISKVGGQCVKDLRRNMDNDLGARERPLWMAVDGSFTNREVLKNLPERTVLIGRIRKDANLCFAPEQQPSTGRRRGYGEKSPTPEQLRQDESIPWERVEVFAAGKLHQFKVKTMEDLRWRVAGADKKLRVIVIAPLGYRPRKGSRILYRKPAYLICTDCELPLQKLLQAYVWRWDIEVNFRDEKTLLGVGQAQVRNENSVEAAPALVVGAYAMLLLASVNVYGIDGMPDALPPPKWRNRGKPLRASTNSLINMLRYEMWNKALGQKSFTRFASATRENTNPQKLNPQLSSAVLYAVG